MFVYSVQTGSGTHPASYPMGTAGSFPEGKVTTHLHLVSKWRMVALYLYSYMHLHGVVLNYLSTGTTLPFLVRSCNRRLYGIWIFIAGSNKPRISNYISLRSGLILSPHQCPDLQSNPFWGFRPSFWRMASTCVLHIPSISSFLIWSF
jgi:hypothetical protein